MQSIEEIIGEDDSYTCISRWTAKWASMQWTAVWFTIETFKQAAFLL